MKTRHAGVQEPELVRVRWWIQDTLESGHWEVSGVMDLRLARIYYNSGAYERLEIVLDEDGWPLYQGDWADGRLNDPGQPGSAYR